jgi:chorismate synthase
MKIERDTAELTSGVRQGRTLGSPVSMTIRNRDWPNWAVAMSIERSPGAELREVTRPRPGHADLAGALKYLTYDARDVLERASARETAARVAAGAVCKHLLERFGIEVLSHVVSVGRIRVEGPVPWERIAALPDSSPLRCCDSRIERRMMAAIDRARKEGDSLGGCFEVVARGVPPGLGSGAQSDLRLDGRLTGALMTVPAVKAAEIGDGIEAASMRGSQVHDEIFYSRSRRRFVRRTNRAGGLEGGITNGEEVRLRGYLKPLSTLSRPLRTVDLRTKRPSRAQVERTDASPILAAGVVGESVVARVLGEALIDKFGGDHVREMLRNYRSYLRALSRY